MNQLPNLRSDVFFKTVLRGEDEASLYIRDLIIKTTTPIEYHSLYAINPEMLPDYDNNKRMILDVLFETDKGEFVQIEMQNSKLGKDQQNRFQANGCRLVTDQLRKGYSYEELKKVYQIIFINSLNKNSDIKELYTSKNEYGIEEGNNLIYRVFIYVPNIDKVLKIKQISELSEFESLIYLFNYSFDCAIIKTGKKVVEYMKRRTDPYYVELEQLWYQRAREDGERIYRGLEQRAERTMKLLQEAELKLESTNQQLESASLQLESTNQQLESTSQQLESTNQQLESTSQQLENTNQQLESTNQQLESTNQQLESTSQQLETAKIEKNTLSKHLTISIQTIMTKLEITLNEAMDFLNIPLEDRNILIQHLEQV